MHKIFAFIKRSAFVIDKNTRLSIVVITVKLKRQGKVCTIVLDLIFQVIVEILCILTPVQSIGLIEVAVLDRTRLITRSCCIFNTPVDLQVVKIAISATSETDLIIPLKLVCDQLFFRVFIVGLVFVFC